MREILIGEIIKQRRMELGLTQEELCEGVCEAPTLSRIESGRQTPSRSKLNVLLQRLALPGNKYYALMSENELAIEQLKTEIISCNMRRDSREGLRKLQSLSELVDADDHLTKQFILRSKVLLGKEEKGEIVPYCFEEKLDLLYQAIRLTIPAFDISEIGKHWYSLDEMKIINQIGITYGEHQQELQAIDIYYQFLKYIQKSKFQINNDNVPVAILVAYNYSLLLCKKQHYEEAMEIANWGWDVAVHWGRSTYVGGLLYVLGESSYQLGKITESEQYYLQSYYAFSLSKDSQSCDDVRENIEDHFPHIKL